MRFLALGLMVAGCATSPSASQDYRQPKVTETRVERQLAPRGDGPLRRAMLDVHNAARAQAGVPPLAWNDDLAADAARYAAVLAQTRTFQHSTEPRGRVAEGENLFMGSRGDYRYEEMAQLWVDERRSYVPGAVPDISTTGHWQDVGHYSQIVWRRTTDVGCALASSRSDDYLVCRYTPPGNMWGRMAAD